MNILLKRSIITGGVIISILFVYFIINALLTIQYYTRFSIEDSVGECSASDKVPFICPAYPFFRFILVFPDEIRQYETIQGAFKISDTAGNKIYIEKFSFSKTNLINQREARLDTLFLTPLSRELSFTVSFCPVLEIGNQYFLSYDLAQPLQEATKIKIRGGTYRYLNSGEIGATLKKVGARNQNKSATP